MPLFDYYCRSCNQRFEQVVDSRGEHDPEAGRCPHCGDKKSDRLISRFAVGGRGDLRESTFHGCHEHFDGLPHSDYSHEHE